MSYSEKQVLIFTHVDYWRRGAGHRSRITELIDYLSSNVALVVLYIGNISSLEISHLKEEKRYSFHSIDFHTTNPFHNLSAIESFLQSKSFDVVIVEFIELSFILDYLTGKTLKIIDTHDLVSSRIESFRKSGLTYDGIQLTQRQEFDLLSCYDLVMVIQRIDFGIASNSIPESKLLLTPHGTQCKMQRIRPVARHLGFIASEYSPNVQGLEWFITEVWPALSQQFELVLNVYGNIHKGISANMLSHHGIVWHQFVVNLNDAYSNCDIIINPVVCGAGLKIKNVEALANGLPLITTTHAAAGMDNQDESIFMIADSATDFKNKIQILIKNYPKRQSLSRAAYEYAASNFSIESCYKPLLNKILSS